MNIVRLVKKNPLLVIGSAAVVGLALGTGAVPIPALPSRLAPAHNPPPPATPPPPPDPLDAY